MSDCYYDAAGCLVCPEQAAQAYVPARIDHRAVVGWNAGANSIDTRAGTAEQGNLYTKFTMPAATAGAVVGLKGSRDRQTVPDLIEHGWFFQTLAGLDMAQVVERGAVKTSAVSRDGTDTFEIRRVNGHVTYWKNNTLVYTSLVSSAGAKVVNTCLYASGDHIGEAA